MKEFALAGCHAHTFSTGLIGTPGKPGAAATWRANSMSQAAVWAM
jgi:hypothetical protein